ncbi:MULTISPECIES: putative thiazole-containing bacteriocin maturation protein [unclassified Paenibacillus]|uniref:putative thiazole-containing bacteriocin maturation protein n=1 Tax=unclassified Paenibacillus TaxID=185978 RepID=UPI0010463D74|nr:MULTISPECIES: putative thiazole-containing bacteriocin maturation protein [unclassified Paenibacillus]NIK72125.1 putative thiazole-containing bacteriocin maturation protein [Paenibacillus sp. BK720]TCM88579.1 putative thiazole-containing bacteriocin maturation protein [Paenibacillus sp. BK033]
MDPSTRLKVRGDTFFLPGSDGSVFFRNNIGSLRMEGSTIDQWIEKLIPVFNGEHTMHDLTDGLPEQHRNHVYEIAKVLYANGYVQDVSRDRPHQLPESVVKRYDSQIEFLDSFDGSGAYRFQLYRQSSVLVVGTGTFLVSLVKSLFESGLPQFHFVGLNLETANRTRIWELEQHYRKSDSEVKVDEIGLPKNAAVDWSSIVEPYAAVLFVSDRNGEPELRLLNEVCRQKNKDLLLAVIFEQAGLAAPFSYSNSEGDWESAWRRVHHSAIYKDTDVHAASSVAEALLANVIVFEWLKTAAEVTKLEKNNKLFLLNLETLEGNWHPFLPHPLVNGHRFIERIEDARLQAGTDAEKPASSDLLPFLSQLTSTETGIFHIWEEGELGQLPLSQCCVQPVDPLSVGPALLLPEIICNGYKHEEARREAGLRGIEAYVSRMANFDEIAHVGAGETMEEGVCRALQKYLMNARIKSYEAHTPSISPVKLSHVADERCRYYLNALTTMQGAPTLGLGEDVLGFPVVWLQANDRWYDAADLNVTRALRSVLMHALFDAQNNAAQIAGKAEHVAINAKESNVESILIPACDPFEHRGVLQMAVKQLNRIHKRLLVFDLTPEPFLREGLAGVYGVSLREVVEE